jgi:hypothetical protein
MFFSSVNLRFTEEKNMIQVHRREKHDTGSQKRKT